MFSPMLFVISHQQRLNAGVECKEGFVSSQECSLIASAIQTTETSSPAIFLLDYRSLIQHIAMMNPLSSVVLSRSDGHTSDACG